jgi:hypothetical protein
MSRPVTAWLERNDARYSEQRVVERGKVITAARGPARIDMARTLLAGYTAVTPSLIMTTACPLQTGASTWNPVSLAAARGFPVYAQWVWPSAGRGV